MSESESSEKAAQAFIEAVDAGMRAPKTVEEIVRDVRAALAPYAKGDPSAQAIEDIRAMVIRYIQRKASQQ